MLFTRMYGKHKKQHGYRETSMYKLVATLSNGMTYTSSAPSIQELQRIAVALNARSYWVELHGDSVYSFA
jgi:hypothetical protein